MTTRTTRISSSLVVATVLATGAVLAFWKYSDVKEVFKMTKDAGFQDVGLIAEKKQKGVGG